MKFGVELAVWVSNMRRAGWQEQLLAVGISGLQRQQHHLKTGCSPLAD